MRNTTSTNTTNGVNVRVSHANSVTLGRISVQNQAEAGGYYATGYKKMYIRRKIKEKGSR